MNEGKQERIGLSRVSGVPQREISALMLSLRKAIKPRGNNASVKLRRVLPDAKIEYLLSWQPRNIHIVIHCVSRRHFVGFRVSVQQRRSRKLMKNTQFHCEQCTKGTFKCGPGSHYRR